MKMVTLKTEEQLTIRRAEPTDAAALIQFIKKAANESHFLSFESEEFTNTEAEQKAIIKAHQTADNQLFLIAELSNEVVALLKISASHKKRSKHVGEVAVSVAKAHWNKGIARLLFHQMIDWASQHPIIRKIDLEVQADNTAAIHLYQKLGFEKEGLRRRGSMINGQFYDLLLMGRIFDGAMKQR